MPFEKNLRERKVWEKVNALPAQPIFFPRIDDSHSDRIHSSLTTFHRFGYVGKQPVALKEYCAVREE